MKKMTKKMEVLTKLARKADEDEIKFLIELVKKSGMKDTDIRLIKESHFFKNNNVRTLPKKLTRNMYADEINKIKFISKNKELIEKIGGLKILLYGKTGSGKTTAIKEVIEELVKDDSNEYKEINFERMISHKMGQSQINILNLIEDIKISNKKRRQIIFIDELDSIISNRGTNNEIGEHHRIVATFIKFLDKLPSNVIIFSATNVPEKIDEAILRRFTLKIKGKQVKFNDFLKILKDNFSITSNKFSKYIKSDKINYLFTISDLNEFVNSYELQKAITKKDVDPFIHFVVFFKENIKIDFNTISERTKIALTKEGIYE